MTSTSNKSDSSSHPNGSSSRAHSPPLHADHSSLPPKLKSLAKEGYSFTKGPAHHLIVYTDGSGLGNGKRGARAGLGVFWGSYGEAAERYVFVTGDGIDLIRSSGRNLAERVPGERQTNNRGELLVSFVSIRVQALVANQRYLISPSYELSRHVLIPNYLSRSAQTRNTPSCVCPPTSCFTRGMLSRCAHAGMTSYLPGWIKSGFRAASTNGKFGKGRSTSSSEIKNADMVKHLLVLLRRRRPGAGVKFKYVPGHSGYEGNEAADVSLSLSLIQAVQLIGRCRG